MSVLCCTIPDFLTKLHLRSQGAASAHPFALVGPDERICGVSPLARQEGVARTMTPKQGLLRCPDLRLQPLDLPLCQAEQAAFLDRLARWELPVEEQGWGAAYVDLHPISQDRRGVQPLAAELGRGVRATLGDALQPALGWDHGKFTSRAAAMRTAPGHLKLVDQQEEVAFLRPLPITLLPLPAASLQRLTWLGITTLGDFARLPRQAVVEHFGKVGQLAQGWAQGRDERPVCNTVRSLFAPLHLSIDPPTALLEPVLQEIMWALRPHLQAMAAYLEGCRRLSLALNFTEGEARPVDVLCLEPVDQAERLQGLIAAQLRAVVWPGELSAVRIVGLERGELPMQQLALLPAVNGGQSSLAGLVAKLKVRYGAVFWQGQVVEPTHRVAERRFRLR